MSQVSSEARIRYDEIFNDVPTRVQILGTDRVVKLRGMKPYTIERLTKLWLERDATLIPNDASSTLKSMCKDPYFAIKEAVIMTLNGWWSIHLLYWIKWRIWAYLREYTERQMSTIIQEGKKKLPLTEHWMNMAYSVDMRMDWMKMTTKEAEQYRAELLSEASRHLSKSSPNMEGGDME